MRTEFSSHKRQSCKSSNTAEHFNDYFTSIIKELQKHIPPTKRNFSDNLKNPNTESFFITPTTPEEISDLMQALSSNKSTEPKNIPTSILKKLKNEISIPLSAIITNSFENGILSSLLKSAKVIPLFKNVTTTEQSLFCPT